MHTIAMAIRVLKPSSSSAWNDTSCTIQEIFADGF